MKTLQNVMLPVSHIMAVLFVMATLNANAQWVNAGVEGGFCLSLGVSPVNSGFVLAGGDIKGGIYRSVDGGGNWEYAGQRMQQFLCFAFHPQDENIAYAGGSNGLYKSTDKGSTWTRVAFADTMVFSVKFNPLDPDVIYLGTGSLAWDGTGYGIFKSTDGSLTYTCVGLAPNLITEIQVSDEDTSKIIASCGSGVYVSVNSGLNWTLTGPTKDLWVGLPTSAIAWEGGDTAYACTFYQPGDYYKEGTVFRSTDGGMTWDSLYAFLSNIESIKVDPVNAGIVYVGVFESLNIIPGIWKSTDAGQTWQVKNNGIGDLMLKDIAIDPGDPSVVYTTGDGGGGIYKTTDGGENWSAVNTGMHYFIGFDTKHFRIGSEDYIYAINSFGVYVDIPQIFRMNISTGLWEPCGIMATDTNSYDQTMFSIYDIAKDPVNDSLMYSGGVTHSGGIHNYPTQGVFYRSIDGGITWQQPYYFDTLLVYSIEVIYNGPQQIILVGTGSQSNVLSGVWKSLDGGLSFTQTSGWFPGVQVMDVEADPFDPTKVEAATVIGMFLSNDYGSSWSISPSWNIDSIKMTYRLLPDESTQNRFFTANGGWLVNTDTTGYGGISMSDNSWTTYANIGLDHNNGMGLAMCGNILFAGIGGIFTIASVDTIPGKGVWYTDVTQQPFAWHPLDTAGMESKFVLSLACFDSILYAGTLGGGVWKYDVTQLVTNSLENTFSGFSGIDIWPNPFTSSVTIRSDITVDSEVVVLIYDSYGRTIERTVKTAYELKSGITWNPNGLSDGIYYVVVNSGSRQFSKKIVFSK